MIWRMRLLWIKVRAFVLHRVLHRPIPKHVHTQIEDMVAMTMYATALMTILHNAPRVIETIRASSEAFADVLSAIEREDLDG